MLPPNTVHGLNTAFFSAMSVSVLCNPFLCYPLHCI